MAANNVANIVVQANTDGATTALEKAARATDQVTTASQAAGAQLADLNRQTQATSKAQSEATAAINRMRQAQDEATLTARAFGENSKEAAEAQARLARAVDTAKKAEAAAKVELDGLKNGLAATSAAADKASPALARATTETNRLSAAAERNANELKKAELSQLASARASNKAASGFGNIATVAAGAVAAGAVASLTNLLKEGFTAAIATGASYETMRIALETTVGSASKAATEFERLQQFAAATPYGVEEVTNAFIKLGNRGIEPTDRLLTSFGNTASAMGKTLDDYVEAVADAVTGENERLKEFGIVGKKNGDMIAYTFKGVTEEVRFNAESITEYLTKIGETEFAGGMERQSQSLAGMWSTQKDNAAALADEFTQGLAPALKDIMASFGGVDENGRSFAKSLGEDVGAAAKVFVTIMREIVDTLSGDNGAIAKFGLLTVATGGLYIPFKAASEAASWMSEAIYGEQEALASVIQPATEFGGITLEIANAMGGAIQQTDAWRGASLLLTEALRLQAVEQEYANEQAKLAATMVGPAVPATGFSLDSKGNHNPDKVKKGKKSKTAAAVSSGDMAIARIGEGREDTDAIALEANIMDRSNAAAAEAAAIDENISARERSIEAIDREIEAREAAGLATDDLLARRFEQERALQDFTVANIKDRSRLEELQTRTQKQQHDKRLRDLKATYAKEQQETAKRQAHLEIMAGHVEGFSNAVVGAMDEEAEGSKGAVAKSLSAWLKGIRTQMVVKGAVELAWVAASAATFNPAGVAAHGTAAAMAFAAAAAAGIAGAAIGAAVPSDSGSAATASAGAGAGAASAAPTGGAGGGGGSGGDGNEKQKVPLSYEQSRRDADMPQQAQRSNSAQAPVTINITGGYIGDERKLAAELDRVLRKAPREGRRY